MIIGLTGSLAAGKEVILECEKETMKFENVEEKYFK